MAILKVAQYPEVVFNLINDVSKWRSKDFKGGNVKSTTIDPPSP